VVLLRVSTQKQGADGLGIAAQKRDIEIFLQQKPEAQVLKELVEVESGGKELKDRPVLQEAINLCKSTSSTLLVATLSRLSRDAAFVLTLMKDTSIRFQVASMPNAENFQLGIYALLNQQEREQVSTRTRAALAAVLRPRGSRACAAMGAASTQFRCRKLAARGSQDHPPDVQDRRPACQMGRRSWRMGRAPPGPRVPVCALDGRDTA
jgi:hypothetical protein